MTAVHTQCTSKVQSPPIPIHHTTYTPPVPVPVLVPRATRGVGSREVTFRRKSRKRTRWQMANGEEVHPEVQ
eukprot:scaffold146299_cov39-Tisochrysis_lutea.AAC.1